MIERSLIILALALVTAAAVLGVRAWSGRRVEGLKMGESGGL